MWIKLIDQTESYARTKEKKLDSTIASINNSTRCLTLVEMTMMENVVHP